MAAHHGNNYLPLLERFYKSHRAVLFTLVDALEPRAASAERGVLDAVEFIRANRTRDDAEPHPSRQRNHPRSAHNQTRPR